VPEEKKALPEVPPSHKRELESLGESLRSSLGALDASPLGIARREQELISKCGNWAWYYPHPPGQQDPKESAQMSVKDVLDLMVGITVEDVRPSPKTLTTVLGEEFPARPSGFPLRLFIMRDPPKS
jgi:hypothetical protein